MIKEVSFEECTPLLSKLWSLSRVIRPIDNFGGLLMYPGNEIANLNAKYFVYYQNDVGVGTTHSYLIDPDTLRIRGTWVSPDLQNSGIGRQLVEHAIRQYPAIKQVVTFPRGGAEKFYESVGFKVRRTSVKTLASSRENSIAVMRVDSPQA